MYLTSSLMIVVVPFVLLPALLAIGSTMNNNISIVANAVAVIVDTKDELDYVTTSIIEPQTQVEEVEVEIEERVNYSESDEQRQEETKLLRQRSQRYLWSHSSPTPTDSPSSDSPMSSSTVPSYIKSAGPSTTVPSSVPSTIPSFTPSTSPTVSSSIEPSPQQSSEPSTTNSNNNKDDIGGNDLFMDAVDAHEKSVDSDKGAPHTPLGYDEYTSSQAVESRPDEEGNALLVSDDASSFNQVPSFSSKEELMDGDSSKYDDIICPSTTTTSTGLSSSLSRNIILGKTTLAGTAGTADADAAQATTITVTPNNKKVFGVNYGSIFVPEDWTWETDQTEFYKGCTPFSVDSNKDPNRFCLAGLPLEEFEKRYLARLDKFIQEDDFKVMATTMGVNTLRVPCGYWNWVSYPGDSTPNGQFSERMRVLQSISPSRFRVYFDRIFQWANKYGIKILLDLHGLPGSQNGEMHSGLTVEYSQFDTNWNKHMAIEAVEEMVKYCMEKEESLSTLYGIQIINEPNHYRDDSYGYGNPHDFLEIYYDEAIRAARQIGLPLNIPLIVFEWTYNFDQWPDDRFGAYDTYGNVMWDTHVYHTNMNMMQQDENGIGIGIGNVNVNVLNINPSREDHSKRYWNDLCLIEQFHNRQSGGVVVGEWSLAGPTWSKTNNQKFALWLVSQFNKRCHGSLFWTWEADITEWSFKKSKVEFEIDWKSISEGLGIETAVAASVASVVSKPTPNNLIQI